MHVLSPHTHTSPFVNVPCRSGTFVTADGAALPHPDVHLRRGPLLVLYLHGFRQIYNDM